MLLGILRRYRGRASYVKNQCGRRRGCVEVFKDRKLLLQFFNQKSFCSQNFTWLVQCLPPESSSEGFFCTSYWARSTCGVISRVSFGMKEPQHQEGYRKTCAKQKKILILPFYPPQPSLCDIIHPGIRRGCHIIVDTVHLLLFLILPGDLHACGGTFGKVLRP